MSKGMRFVLGVLIAILILAGSAIVLKACGDNSDAAKDSFFVRQRMINLKKGE